MKKLELIAKDLVLGYAQKIIVQDLNIQIPKGKISVIIGGNGCGKSTFLKSLARLIHPFEGSIELDGEDIHHFKSKEFAQTLGLLPQYCLVPSGIKVRDLVARGRFPYQDFFGSLKEEDYQIVEESMRLMGIYDLMDMEVESLSGGQRQRVWIAMVLAQNTDILLLDEPTTYLDIAYQLEILDLLIELNRKKKTTIVMVLHDLNLSARYADHIFALKTGKLIKEGSPRQVITPEIMKEVFGIECLIIEDPISKTPLVVPQGKYYA